MKKILIMIFMILCSYIYGNNYEILEENGELFFKYSKNNILNEVRNILDENKEILSKDFKLVGEKKYIEEIRFGKNYIDKTRYNICKIENEIERCIFYMSGKKKYYKEMNLLDGNLIKKLSYENFGKNIKTFSTEKNVLWFKNNKLIEYVEYVKSEDGENLGTITYIFDKKDNLEKIKVLNSIWITVKLKEKEATTSSIGGENYYFTPEGKFMKKETYYKNTPRKE